MTEPNWNLLGQPVDVGGRFQQGYDGARVARQQNALLEQQQEQQREQQVRQGSQQKLADHTQQIEQHREAFIMGARFLSGVADEATYQQRRQMAGQAGMDLTDVPEHFDPEYVRNVVDVGTRLSQRPGEAFTLGEGQARFDGNGNRIASGPAARPRYYPLAPGGRLQLDPAYQDPAAPPQAAPPPVAQGDRPAPQADEASLRAEAAAAIAAGRDPALVNARLEQLLRGGPAPSAPGTFPW